MTLKLQKLPKCQKQHKMSKKIHYKITIFGAYAPYPRLILNCIVYLARKKMTCHQNPGPAHNECTKCLP